MRLRCAGRNDAGTGEGNGVSVRSYFGDDRMTEYTRRYLGDSIADAGSTPAASTSLRSQQRGERRLPRRSPHKRRRRDLRFVNCCASTAWHASVGSILFSCFARSNAKRRRLPHRERESGTVLSAMGRFQVLSAMWMFGGLCSGWWRGLPCGRVFLVSMLDG